MRMLKNNLITLSKLILCCLALFLVADTAVVLLASLIVYFKKDFFSFSWQDVFSSFCESGYVGGLILGVGIWIKVTLEERKDRKKPAK